MADKGHDYADRITRQHIDGAVRGLNQAIAKAVQAGIEVSVMVGIVVVTAHAETEIEVRCERKDVDG